MVKIKELKTYIDGEKKAHGTSGQLTETLSQNN